MLFAITVVIVMPAVFYRFAQGGLDLRLDLWRSATAIFIEHPLTGAGPGTWVQLKVGANPTGAPNLILPHAHSLYFQTLAELGIMGALALIYAAAAGLELFLRLVARGERLGLEAAAVLVALAGLAGQSLVDNVVNLPFVCLLVIGLVAWIDSGALTLPDLRIRLSGLGARSREPQVGEAPSGDGRGGLVLAVAGLVGVVGAIPMLAMIDRASLVDLSGNEAALRGDWQAAFAAYDAAERADPAFTLYRIQAASAASRSGRSAEARDLLAAAVKDDQTAILLVSLAVMDSVPRSRDALAEARRATELGYGEAPVALNAGLVGERAGDEAFALEQYAFALAWDPPLAGSDFFRSADRTIDRNAIVSAARERSDAPTAALILAYSGDTSTARSEITGLPDSARQRVYLSAIDWLAGDVPAAIARIEAILEEDPLDWFAASWLARIERASGDKDAADRYEQWALLVQADEAPAVITQVSQIPAGTDAPGANLPTNYPWSVYLRPSSAYLLPDGVILVGAASP